MARKKLDSTEWYEQGDVLIIPAKIPAGVRTERGRILAYGEVTGHCHRLTDASDGLLIEVDGVLYLKVGPGGVDLAHEEHTTFEAQAGRRIDYAPDHPTDNEYRVGRVREYDHFAEEARQVQD